MQNRHELVFLHPGRPRGRGTPGDKLGVSDGGRVVGELGTGAITYSLAVFHVEIVSCHSIAGRLAALVK
jgi:hypothetical protein